MQVTGTVLDWLLGTGPRPGIIQDWAEHEGAAVSMDGAEARVDNLRPSPLPEPVCTSRGHGHLWDTARKLALQPSNHLVGGVKAYSLP